MLFSKFAIEHLCAVFACSYGAQVEPFKQKNCRKSRDTVLLILIIIIFYFNTNLFCVRSHGAEFSEFNYLPELYEYVLNTKHFATIYAVLHFPLKLCLCVSANILANLLNFCISTQQNKRKGTNILLLFDPQNFLFILISL